VWLTGIVPPLSSCGALGLPGSSSMKKLPSRKILGLIAAKASSWIGRPEPSTVNLTLVAFPSLSVEMTFPTSTPAIRTGELRAMLAEFENVALTS
jgi:hypothetical protein